MRCSEAASHNARSPEKTEARSILPTTAASFSTLFNEQRSFLKMRDTALFEGGQPQRPTPQKTEARSILPTTAASFSTLARPSDSRKPPLNLSAVPGSDASQQLETQGSAKRQRTEGPSANKGGESKMSTSFPVRAFTETAEKSQVTAPIAQCSSRARSWRSTAVRDGQPPLHSSGGKMHSAASKTVAASYATEHAPTRCIGVYVCVCVRA